MKYHQEDEVVQEAADVPSVPVASHLGEANLPPNVTAFKDQYGKTRYRFRRRGLPSRSIPGPPGSPLFEEAYEAATKGQPGKAGRPKLSDEQREFFRLRQKFRDFCDRSAKNCQRRAGEGGLAFDLTAEFLEGLLIKQDWRCAVSGIRLEISKIGERKPFSPSIDRIVPVFGYTQGNIRIVCRIVNFAMNDWGPEPLYRLVMHMAQR